MSCRRSDIPIYYLIFRFSTSRKQEMKKKQAKNWTRNVICIVIFQVFHPTDVEIKVKVSKRFLSSIRTWLFFFFNRDNISRGTRGFVNNSWFDYVPLTTWNLLEFRVAEKEKLLKQYLFAQPWWSRLWSAFLAIRCISKVISRKLIGQIILHGPYTTGTTYFEV